jgi:hypothetical protein
MPLRNGYNNISSSAKESGNDNCLGSRHPLSTRSCTCTWQTWELRGGGGGERELCRRPYLHSAEENGTINISIWG